MMQQQKDTKTPPIQAVQTLPPNPVQTARELTWHPDPDATEFASPWHPQDDVIDLEETLDQAVAQLRAVLKLLATRTHPDVKKAREFVRQFD